MMTTKAPDPVRHIVDDEYTETDIRRSVAEGLYITARCGHVWVPTYAMENARIWNLCANCANWLTDAYTDLKVDLEIAKGVRRTLEAEAAVLQKELAARDGDVNALSEALDSVYYTLRLAMSRDLP